MKIIIKMFLVFSMAMSLIILLPSNVSANSKPSFVNEYEKVGRAIEIDTSSLNGNITYEWSVNEVIVSRDASYTPQSKDMNHFIEVVISDGSQQYQLQTYLSGLPVIYIDVEDGKSITSKDEYLNCNFKIQGNEEFNQTTTTLYDGLAEIKGRGNSTWQLPKKPYRIKLDKGANLFGFGKSKHWVLLANYYDTTFLRNKLGYDLSGSLGMPYMQSQLVDVVLNGQYVGNYQLCEHMRVDENRINITNWEDIAEDAAKQIAKKESLSDEQQDELETLMVENLSWITNDKVICNETTYQVSDYIEYPDLTGGYLLENDKNYDEISKFILDSGMPIMFKSPEYANTNQQMMNYVQGYLQAFENAVRSTYYTTVYDGDKKHYSELFDMNSLIDVWIVQEIFLNADFMKNSTYMYKNHGELFKMGPVWDLDWTSGVEHSSSMNYELWATQAFNNDEDFRSWYTYLIQDPYFLKLVQNRYLEVRDTEIQAMYDSIDEYQKKIIDSANATLKIWNEGKDYKTELNMFKTWMCNRIDFIDQKIADYDRFVAAFDSTATKLEMSANTEVLEDDTYHYRVEQGTTITVSDTVEAQKVAILRNNQLLTEFSPSSKDISYQLDINEDSVIQFIYTLNDGTTKRAYLAVACSEREVEVVDCVFTGPLKTHYTYGEALDLAGLSLNLVYSDQSTQEVKDYQISTYNPKQLGVQTITISYDTYKFSFDVEVVNDLPFKDVHEKEWYFDVVYQAYQLNLLRGTSKTTFNPDDPMNRAMIACVLHRMDGEKAIVYEPIFVDVKDKIYYSIPITWAKTTSVINGHQDGTFKPNDDVTREELAIMLCNFVKYQNKYQKPQQELMGFEDDDKVNDYALDAMKWCVENKIITGKNGGLYLDPQGKATRAEASKMLVLVYEMLTK